MFVRVKQKQNGKKAVQIVSSHRRANKVTQKIVRHIGQAETEYELQELKKLAASVIQELKHQRQPCLPLFEPAAPQPSKPLQQPSQERVDVSQLREEQRVIEGIPDVFGALYDQLGMNTLIRGSRNNAGWNKLLRICTLARLANPASKRRTASLLEQDFGIRVPLEKIYRLMDHVARCEESIKRRIALSTKNLFKQEVDILFFDVTTLYFESTKTDELRQFGFSKDCKFKETQVVLALVTTTQGLPLTYQLFPGNTCEGKTLVEIVRKLQEEYDVKQVSLVADRALFTEENLAQMDALGVHYIIAAKLKTLSRSMQDKILNSQYKLTAVDQECHWVKEFEHKERRLIVSYSSKRAKKDASDRNKLVERLMKKAQDGQINLKDLIPNYGSKKYITVANKKAQINTDKIEQDAQWDGLHGVISNCSHTPAEELLEQYRRLWQIEEAFRVSKHDLKMRPIYHWTPERIRAHIAICFLAYTVAKQALYRIQVQHTAMSFEQLRNELLHCQASLLQDIETKQRYRIPSALTQKQKKLYQIFGLKRSEVPKKLDT